MIYLNDQLVCWIKIVVFILIFLLLYGLGYCYQLFRVKDYDSVYVTTLENENQYLKEELFQRDIISEDLLITKVLYRDIYCYNQEVIIENKGNIETNDLVLGADGLVGIIDSVQQDKAYVKLIDKDYHISVKVGDTYGDLYNGIIELLDKYSDISIGEKVYTSGIGYLNGNVYVGEIEDIIHDKNTSGVRLKVQLVDNQHLNYVGIMKGIS